MTDDDDFYVNIDELFAPNKIVSLSIKHLLNFIHSRAVSTGTNLRDETFITLQASLLSLQVNVDCERH